MDHFFDDRRHRCGLMTLVIALAIMVLWFRSHVVIDDLSGGVLDRFHLQTDGGDVVLSLTQFDYCGEVSFLCGGAARDLSWSTELRESNTQAGDHDYQVTIGGMGLHMQAIGWIRKFDDLATVTTQVQSRASLIWFVLPLAMLSAYLLVTTSTETRFSQ